MPTGFHATSCAITKEHGILVTVLGAPPLEEEDLYLMLQHKQRYDDQDIKFGMNRPYLEFCGQGWSWYGHILGFVLLRDRVRLQMDEEAAAHMQNDGHIEVTFSLTESDFDELRAAIGTTFSGNAFFKDEA